MGGQDVNGEAEGTSSPIEYRFVMPEWVLIVGILLLLYSLFSMYNNIVSLPRGIRRIQTTSLQIRIERNDLSTLQRGRGGNRSH
jgi:hypothetical protein